MSGWVLVPCLVSLRGEFNAVAPGRDRSSDGTRGDARHALVPSDHNPDETGRTPFKDADYVDEVHAFDVDDTGPWPPGFDFDDTVERIRLRHALGEDDRLQNIIRNGRVASRSWGWGWRTYTGPNGHYEHAHFSARYTTEQENDTSPWGVAVILDQADAKLVVAELMRTQIGEMGSFSGTVQTRMRRTDVLANTEVPALRRQVQDLDEKVTALTVAVHELLQLARAATPPA